MRVKDLIDRIRDTCDLLEEHPDEAINRINFLRATADRLEIDGISLP